MLLNEFSETYFKQLSEQQKELLYRFQKERDANGWPHRYRLLRHLAKTRKYTRSVYPPGWRFI
jgi:hypothetical protein